MKYAVCFEREGNSWGAYVPDLPGCVAVGKSKEQVQTLIAEAIEFHIEGLSLAGEDVPKPTTKLPAHKNSNETSGFIETQVPWISDKHGETLPDELRDIDLQWNDETLIQEAAYEHLIIQSIGKS